MYIDFRVEVGVVVSGCSGVGRIGGNGHAESGKREEGWKKVI